jgi:phospholipase C
VIIIDRIEATYNVILTRLFRIANPMKKSIKKTECKVHIFLNQYAIDILLNSKYIQEYNLINSYSWSINEGSVWADQDFKSSSHFYNPFKKRGLYGRKNALELAKEYYQNAINIWRYGDKRKAMFYLGAAAHLVQDMTVPQHANIRLLDDHHQYETFVKKVYKDLIGFTQESSPYILNNIEDYIRFNARMSLKVYRKFKNIKEDDCRYFRIIKCTLPLAKRTTAGLFITFYRDINDNN